jgi:2-(1,2-epoxy-1,2-dihydrophenyl)acetyl-CoA isomerase
MPPVLFEMRGSIACITLNRPEKYNAFNREMALLLQQTLDECQSKDVRCVYLTGAGKAFSAGQDLDEVSDPKTKITHILMEQYNPIVRRIRKLEKPVVAAVNGVAAGAGANIGLQKASALAMLCDKVRAEEAERMNMIYKWFGDAEFAAQSFSIAHTLAQLPTRGLALTKIAFNNSLINNWEDQLHDEELLQERAGRTHDYKEGVQAFLEKRTPLFRGE